MMKVRSLSLWLTEGCNLDCEYCYEHRGSQVCDSEKVKQRIQQLFIEDVMDLKAEWYAFSFFGGEPLTEWDKLTDLAGWLRDTLPKPVRLHVTTNGTLIDDERAAWLHDHEFSMLLSIDGDEQAMKARSGAYQSAVAGWEAMKLAGGVHVEGNMCFGPAQIDRWEENIGHLISLGFQFVNLNPQEPAPYEYEQALGVFRELFRKYALDWYPAGIRISTLDRAIRAVSNPQPAICGCGAGKGMLGIGPDGEIYPCHHFPQIKATKLTLPDGRINHTEKAWWEQFDSRDNEMCEQCAVRRWCMGSCAAINGGATGDFHVPVAGTCTFMRAKLVAALSAAFEMDPAMVQEVLVHDKTAIC